MTRPDQRPLYIATILAGSFLLFLIQPMVARMALPRLGGAPNVWNSAMLVYQALLLAGYAYAHALGRWPLRRQAGVHLAVLLVAALWLPVGLVNLPPPRPGSEVFAVPLLFALSIGPVFFAIAAQAPLLQRWYAADPRAGEPWALYAASNLGSFAGLLAYPLLAEPLLALHAQRLGWSALYALLVVLVALCARARWGGGAANAAGPAAVAAGPTPPVRTIALWLALAAVPSGLMLSTTTHLTTDLFAMPLLWVIPLGLYLLSFVVAFADWRGPARAASAAAWMAVLTAGGLAMISRGAQGMVPVALSLALLFLISTALHARLYDWRPEPARLTQFYLVMAAGGALGGVFTALLAPLVFDWVWEHPLLVLAAAALLPRPRWLDWRRLPGLEEGMVRLGLVLLVALGGFVLWRLWDINQYEDTAPWRWFYAGAAALIGLALIPWRSALAALVLGLMLAQGGAETLQNTRDHLRTRSYFGVYTIRNYPEQRLRTLAHGTTLHGEESTDPRLARTPLTYYGPGAGAGIVFGHADRLFAAPARVGVLGLGVGTLACFHHPGETLTVFEIDPVVVRYSRDGTFRYLADCAPQAQVVIGDARLAIAGAPRGSFDLLAIDAFQSDAVPLHLMTDEAFGVYLSALSPKGVMMVNISNRFIELEPALAAEVARRHLAAAARDDTPDSATEWTPSTWVAISRDPAQLVRIARLAPGAAWRPLVPPAPRVWSDDHASILPYVRWHSILGRHP